MKTLTPTRFQYNLSLLNGGSTTVRVEQKVNGVYQYLATQQTQTTSGTYELSFAPSETDIRISVSGTSRYALNNLYLDRDQIDTLVATYALSRGYRYGFNGMEKDDEVSGKGNSYTAEFWQYDSRLGRRWNVDPVVKHHESPYATFANNPLYFVDTDGKDAIITIRECTITVTAKIYVMNAGEHKINVDEAQKSIMKYWGKKFSYIDDNGDIYNVKFDIKVVEATGNEDPNDASKNWVRPMAADYRSKVTNGRYGYWAKDKKGKTYAYEVGHMLGLADQYVDFVLQHNNTTAFLKDHFSENVDLDHPKEDIMGATSQHNVKSGTEKVVQSAIDAIAKYALNGLKNNKPGINKVVLDRGRLKEAGYKDGLNPPNRNDYDLNDRHRNYKVKEAHSH